MPPAKLSDDEFLRIIKQHGITEKSAKLIGSNVRNINYRRRRLENKYDEPVAPPSRQLLNYPGRYRFNIKNGTVLVGSDFHIWPGETSTCLRAFKKFVADIKPAAVILNGDVMDFPRISRHPQNWESAPDPQEEIEAAQDHLNDIVGLQARHGEGLDAR
jgi:hypothetical protein